MSHSSLDVAPPPIDGKGAPPTDELQASMWKHIQSLIPLVKLLSSHEEYDGKYILAGAPTPESWFNFFQACSQVEKLDLNSEDASKIDPSTFIRIAHQLEKGQPLFPSLRTLSIQDIDTRISFFYLLLSPTLEEIFINLAPTTISTSKDHIGKAEALQVSVDNFLLDFAQFTPNLKILRITNMQKLPQQWLTRISKITKLTVLELKSLDDINNFDDIRMLGALTSLKSLSLEVSTLKYDFLPQSTESLVPFLPHLEDLMITGPLKLVLDLLQNVASEELSGLYITCTTSDDSDETSANDNDMKPKKGKKKKSSLSNKVPDVPENCTGHVGGRLNVISAVSFRWCHTLEKLSFNSAVGTVCDLNHLTSFRKLKNIFIDGGNIHGIDETFSSSTCWRSAETISLPRTVPISLSTLHNIANAAPRLQHLNVNISIRALGLPEKVDILRPIYHTLRSIMILNNQDIEGVKPEDVKWQQIINVARCMIWLFPQIDSIKAIEDGPEWEKVMETIRLCQEFRASNVSEGVQGAKGGVISDFEVV